MTIRFPYQGIEGKDWIVTQGYDSNPINGATGRGFYAIHHGGWDILPLKNQNRWLAPIYPVLDGRTMSVSTTDINRGLGIQVRTVLDPGLITYFKRLNRIPAGYQGEVWLDHIYWHMYKVTDLDGWVDENTSVGLTGNSGYVYAGGLEVPLNQKNVPPFDGLHLHFEYYLRSPFQVFNTNLDAQGRLHPELLWGYKEIPMGQFKTQKKGSELRVVLAASDINQWKVLCAIYGLNPDAIDETVN